MKTSFLRAALPTALIAFSLSIAEARAGDLQLDVAAGGQASTWRGDGGGFTSLQLGYRFADIAAPYFLGRLGYSVVDSRMLMMVALGAQLWGRLGNTRPYARIAFVHQHEEPMPAMEADPLGAMVGVGDGIRHRFGFEGGLGLDVPFYRSGAWELHGRFEGLCTGFPDPRGPAIYGGGTAGLGFNYGI